MADFGDNPLTAFTMEELIEEIRTRCDLYALTYRLKCEHQEGSAGNYSHRGDITQLMGLIELHKLTMWKETYLRED